MFEIRQISYSPVRYGLYEDGEKKLSLSAKVMKANRLEPGKIEKKLELDKIKEEEAVQLKNDFLTYLAGAERSPRLVSAWLKSRDLEMTEVKLWCEWAQKEKLLDATRYAEEFIHRHIAKGNLPWWQVKEKLKFQGVTEDKIAMLDYNEELALKNFLRRQSKFRSMTTKEIKKKLTQRGFSFDLVEKVIKDTD